MNQTKFKGNPVQLAGTLPAEGETAPDFTYVKADLSEGSLYEHGEKVKVIIAVPSLDTGVCQMETKHFNDDLRGMDDVRGLIVSKDLPFAMNRFCEAEGVENVEIASVFRSDFEKKYNALMVDGPLKGLSARAVFVVDGDNKIRFVELVDDITHEPDYDAALKAIKSL